MSRIGKKPIIFSSEVMVKLENGQVMVTGPKGTLNLLQPERIKIEIGEGKIELTREGNNPKTKAIFGTTRQNLANMVKGVSEGWSKTLEVVGTGYRASLQEGKLLLSVGFSHPVEIVPLEGISFALKEGKIVVSGSDKVKVGQVAANIRAIRPPDAYKGKGIRYFGEEIKTKPGKAVAKIGLGVAGGGK